MTILTAIIAAAIGWLVGYVVHRFVEDRNNLADEAKAIIWRNALTKIRRFETEELLDNLVEAAILEDFNTLDSAASRLVYLVGNPDGTLETRAQHLEDAIARHDRVESTHRAKAFGEIIEANYPDGEPDAA